jgi:hypothetical protein
LIALETHGFCGGVFASKDAVMRYARFESAGHDGVIRLTPEPFELKFSP